MTAVHGEPSPANEGTAGGGWTVDDSTFGARLALVRQRMRWNIKEAAQECGLPPASWGTWEDGAMPRKYTEVCEKIAARTGADFVWLIAGPGGRTRGAGGSFNATLHTTTPSGEVSSAEAARLPLKDTRPGRTDDPAKSRLPRTGPYAGGRRDSVRPVSSIPVTQRRPRALRPLGRPGDRPMPR